MFSGWNKYWSIDKEIEEMGKNKKTKKSEAITANDLPVVVEEMKEMSEADKVKRKYEKTNHAEELARFTGQVPSKLVDKYSSECGAVAECEKNLAEARKRRSRAHKACETYMRKVEDLAALENDLSEGEAA